MTGRSSPVRWRLYVITDEQVGRGRSHLQIAEAARRMKGILEGTGR
ncbi:hypothetical protein K0B90_00690 [bacterium]|nr:hypothetical protein [bacterium]